IVRQNSLWTKSDRSTQYGRSHGGKRMPSIVRFLPALSLAVLFAGPAHAQLSGFYPMGADSLSLNNDDFKLMIDAANGLLRQSPLRVGATTNWRNSESGSHG